MALVQFPLKSATVKERLLGEANGDFLEGVESLSRGLEFVLDRRLGALTDDEAYELLLSMTLMLQLLDRIKTRLLS